VSALLDWAQPLLLAAVMKEREKERKTRRSQKGSLQSRAVSFRHFHIRPVVRS